MDRNYFRTKFCRAKFQNLQALFLLPQDLYTRFQCLDVVGSRNMNSSLFLDWEESSHLFSVMLVNFLIVDFHLESEFQSSDCNIQQ